MKILYQTAQVAIIVLSFCFIHLSAFDFRDTHHHHHTARLPKLSLTSSSDETHQHTSPHRKRQTRRRPIQRRPDHYWSDPNHLYAELHAFWRDHGIQLPNNTPPPIPNEVLLMYYQRHSLRGALVKYGGREAVSKLLGGSRIVPGRWKDAVQESPELRFLIQADPGLSEDRPPSVTNTSRTNQKSDRWKHQNGRKPKGYWNVQTLLKEVYSYVAVYREKHQRPAVWMPRPSEFVKEGRDDIRQAFYRFGGSERICRLAGMVPFREWYYFEGQLQLLMELQRYLDEHAHGDYTSFPVVEDVRRHGFDQLVSLIQYYGGRKFLSARLGMNSSDSELNFGPFRLEFAVRLLSFVRERELRKNPPLGNPSIMIPSSNQLLMGDEEALYLHESIMKFGGYENVARRLGLGFSSVGGEKGNF